MKYNKEEFLSDLDIENSNIIKTLDVNTYVLLEEFIKNIKFNDMDIEILNSHVKITEFNIKKFDNNLNYIYCINYRYILEIDFSINNLFEKVIYEDILNFSFLYKDLNQQFLELKPFNLNLKLINYKLYINISFVIINQQIQLIKELNKNKNNQIIENTNQINYDYIDLTKEFI